MNQQSYLKALPLLAVLTITSFLAACSIHSGPTTYRINTLSAQAPLSQSKAAFVARPNNFMKGTSGVTGSGEKTQTAMQKALTGQSIKATYAPTWLPLEKAQEAARQSAADYVIWMELLQWEDPPASFQTTPDKGEVLLSVYDAKNGELIRSETIECSGRATTVNLIGAYGPEDCLRKGFTEWAQKNYNAM